MSVDIEMSLCVSETKMEMVPLPKYFDTKTVEAQKAAKKKDWVRFKNIFEENKEKLLEPYDMFGNTAIHAIARLGNAKLLKVLLEMLSGTEQKVALRKPNDEGNTILHEVIFGRREQDLETVDLIMNFDQTHQNDEPLLEIKNNIGETPLSRGARFGNLRMLKHIHESHPLQSKHFPRSSKEARPILVTCVLGLHFDVAIWLVKNVDKDLAGEPYMKNCTCFHLLSKMAIAFRNKGILEMGTNEKLIYNLLPEWNDDGNNLLLRSTTDIERGQPDDDETENPSKLIFSRINYAVWKLLAKGFDSIDEIWKRKKRHMFAEHLAKLLVNSDVSWRYSYNKNDQLLVVLPDFPSNVTEKKKEIELQTKLKKKKQIKEKMESKEDIEKEWQTPLFLAAASGNLEVVKIIVNENPEAISHVNKDGLNILFMAVKHRQLEIYEFIEESGAFKSLLARITRKNRYTLLHQAASMEYYRETELPGVAYQLKDELEWYHRVRSDVPEHYLMQCDKDGLTAGDLLDIEHAEMHDEAKQWMKETAQSCSTVAVLIAGVVFAAAYAIPGGTEGGTPVLHTSNVFHVFTIMDVVSLACSLGSVVMFLSILTSSFDLWDFHKSLPRKLKIGFIMLFFSLICTMVAFAATILLTIRMEGNKKTTTLAYSLAIVVVSIFGLRQFPLIKMILDFKQSLKSWVKVKKGARN